MKNLQTVSGYFFFGIGSAYFLLALFAYNKMFFPQSQILFNVFDLPFAFVALLYGGSSLWITLDESKIKSSFPKFILLFWGVVIFAAIVVVNFMFPDVI